MLLPGDGIGPEITDSVLQILSPLKLPIKFHPHYIKAELGQQISPKTLSQIKQYKYALKGPFQTKIGKG